MANANSKQPINSETLPMKTPQTNSDPRGLVAAVLVLCGLLVGLPAVQAATAVQWNGQNCTGNFSYNNNWNWGGSQPSSGFGYELHFNTKTGCQTSMYYDWGWSTFDFILFDSGFPQSDPISGNGNGIHFNNKIENDSSWAQTVNVPTSGSLNGAGYIELDPVNADLTFQQPVYDDNSVGYRVYGGSAGNYGGAHKLILQTDLVGGVASRAGVSMILEDDANHYGIVDVQAAQSWGGSSFIYINCGELWLDTGGSLTSGQQVQVGSGAGTIAAKLWLSPLSGGLNFTNAITVYNPGSSERTIGGLNTSGTDTFKSSIALNGQVNLSAATGGTVNFTGPISGSGQSVVVNGFLLPLTGVIVLSATNTYSGNTYISGGTLQFNSTGYASNSPNFYLGETSGGQTATLTMGATGGGQTLTNAIWVRSGSTGNKTISSLATSGSDTLSGPISLTNNLTVSAAGGGILNLSGVISGSSYGLTNVGGGILTLSGANTYSGATTLTTGTLALGANSVLPSATTVNLAGGTLAMGTYNNTVNAVQISGVTKAKGTWGASGSSANHISASLTGTGILTVSTGGTAAIATPTTSLTPSTYGTAATVTVVVTGSGGDGSAPTGTVTFYDSGVSIGTASLGSPSGLTATASLALSSTLSPGTHSITAAYGGNASYDVSGTSTTLSQVVNKASSTVTPTVGSYTYSGSLQGPNSSSVTGSTGSVTYSYVGVSGTSYSASSTAPTGAGSYTVTATVAADANYNAASSSATAFSIAVKAASIMAAAKTKTYGDVNPALTAVTNGVVNGDVINCTLATLATTYSSVGVSNITVTLGSNPNYSVTKTDSTLTIGAKAATVTADAKTKTYGDVNPALTAVTNGAVNGDVINCTLATLVTTYSSVGVSNITVTLGSNPNYSVLTTNSALTIGAKALSIAATNQTKSYGQTLTFSGSEFTTAGLTNSDTVSSVTLTSSGAVNTAAVATYGIVPSAAVGSGLGNYNISYNSGTLTVNATLTAFDLSSSAPTSGFHDSLFFAATNLPVAAMSNVVFSANGVPFSTNGVATGGVTSLSLSNLPRGTNLITAIYSGDGNYLGSSTTLNQIVTNHPPVANGNTYCRSRLASWGIAVGDLLTNASDVIDGDTLTLAGVGTSTNLVTLDTTSRPGWVMYYNANAVADQFSYTVSDGFGGTNIAVITLTYVNTNAITGTSSIASVAGANPKVLTALGIPYYTYVAERSTNLVNWVGIATNAAATNGAIIISDYFGDLGSNAPASAYYRLKW